MHIFYSLLIFVLLGTLCIAEEHSNDLEGERVKRVAVEDVEFASNNDNERPARLRQTSRVRANKPSETATPVKDTGAIVLPPYHNPSLYPFDKKKSSCLLYLEGISIVVITKKTIGAGQAAYVLPMNFTQDSYGFDPINSVVCPINDTDKPFVTGTPFRFIIDYQVGPKAQELHKENELIMAVSKGFTLALHFVSNTGFDLVRAELLTDLVIEKGNKDFQGATASGNATNVKSVNMRAYYGYNYACSGTQALLFPSKNTDVLVGIIFNNFQVQGYGIDRDGETGVPYFGSKTTDCIPTFNQGTWMGIIVTLILVSVLAFAFLMLNSVQTMDRFDDPKQKQIVINFKE